MRPKITLSLITGLIILGTIGCIFVYQKNLARANDRYVINQLPFEIESTNPVPEVRHWNQHDRTYYYFNWGLKMTGGYSLNLIGVKNKIITIEAISPDSNEMAIQMLTYPNLFLSLPQGTYHYRVVDAKNKQFPGIFKPKNKPLQFTIFLQSKNGLVPRTVLRDPYFNNEGKTTALIALEALFDQPEMFDYLEHEVTVEAVSFARESKSWFVLMSPDYDNLEKAERQSIDQLIRKTVLALKANSLERVMITTHPATLPPLKN